jgi:hypothetical protein
MLWTSQFTSWPFPQFPGISISVVWLFSNSKHTLSNLQSLMAAASALKTDVAKEWLKRGFGDGIEYLDS